VGVVSAATQADAYDRWSESQALDLEDTDAIYEAPEGQAQTDRLLGVLRFLDRIDADVHAVVAARTAELHQWRADRLQVTANRRQQIERLLEGWARAQHAASGGRTKTWKLPSGTLTIRPAQLRLVVSGDEQIAATRARNVLGEQARRTTYSVAKDTVKGLVVPGAPVHRDAAGAPIDVPVGYTAHRAMVRDDSTESGSTGEVLEGLVLLVPTQDTFKAKPTPPPTPTSDADA
jgi:hypothetical protein